MWAHKNILFGRDFEGQAPSQGGSVAISGDGKTVAFGGYDSDFTDSNGELKFNGAVWVFTNLNGVWTQQGSKIVDKRFPGSQQFRVSLSGDGNSLIIGGEAYNDNAGALWIYSRENGAWKQQGEKLTPKDPNGKSLFGNVVDLSADGKTAIVGGPADNETAGGVWVFVP